MPTGTNICKCLTPPGGQGICSEEQLAICRVENGVCYTECRTPPTDADEPNSQAFLNWALSEILQTPRASFASISAEENAIIRRGYYRIPGTSDSVSFSLPARKQRNSPLGA